jgi:hypothetical protein
VILDRLVKWANEVRWGRLVILVYLVLPVLLVLLALWGAVDPQARVVLQGWLRRWLPSPSPPPG